MSGRSESEKTVTHKVQTGGEITINLILTIKLDGDGLSVSTMAAAPMESRRMMKEQILQQPDDEDVDLIVPEISSDGLIQFGQRVSDE